MFVLATGLWPLLRLFGEALRPGYDGEWLGVLRDTLQGRAFRVAPPGSDRPQTHRPDGSVDPRDPRNRPDVP